MNNMIRNLGADIVIDEGQLSGFDLVLNGQDSDTLEKSPARRKSRRRRGLHLTAAPVPKAPACSDISDGDRSTQAHPSLLDRRADISSLGDEIVIYSSKIRYAITSL